jgi:hypothetical protein
LRFENTDIEAIHQFNLAISRQVKAFHWHGLRDVLRNTGHPADKGCRTSLPPAKKRKNLFFDDFARKTLCFDCYGFCQIRHNGNGTRLDGWTAKKRAQMIEGQLFAL